MDVLQRLRGSHLLGFSRRHLRPRIRHTLLHRNVFTSVILSLSFAFTAFQLKWFPALAKVAVKDFATGVLAFSALGFGAATAATVLALAIPKNQLYFTMIANGVGAPRVRITSAAGRYEAQSTDAAPLLAVDYGVRFRSLYGDLMFVFLWTMAAQLLAATASLVYFALAGDLMMVDQTQKARSAAGLVMASSTLLYAILQMGSLIRAMADYAAQQESSDRRELGLGVNPGPGQRPDKG